MVGQVFDQAANPGRKKPFNIRSVMRAVVDQDDVPLERWAGFRNAESAVVWDARLDGWPVCLIGLESRGLPRRGFVAADGPDHWTSGTLFPLSSKKVAWAINAASGNRPVVVLANLSGFDGSPESMRKLQLEYGAEIGRAVVNFDGPLVFCVVSRYHGGAFVVFSAALNDNLEVAAVEGSFASVIGGAPAAAVVSPGMWTPGRGPIHASRPCGPVWPKPRGPTRHGSAPKRRPCTTACARRGSVRWPTSSTPSTASSGPARSGRSIGSSRPATCAPTWPPRWSGGMARTPRDYRRLRHELDDPVELWLRFSSQQRADRV